MKWLIVTLCLSLGTLPVAAQERIPQDQALKYSKILTDHAGKLADLQLKSEVDTDKPFGLRHGEVGVMVIPDKKLSADILAKVDGDVTPIGHLWFRKISPHIDGKTTPNEKLRIVTVTADDQDHPLPLFLLGVRKKNDKLELVIFAKDKEPLLATPLEKIDRNQELPIELEGKKNDNDTGLLTLNLLGKYQAKVTVAAQE